MSAVQFVVPCAAPEPPVEFVQVTRVMPEVSAAVPDTPIDGDHVATMVKPGETIRIDGGVVSEAGARGGSGSGGGSPVGGRDGVTGGGPPEGVPLEP